MAHYGQRTAVAALHVVEIRSSKSETSFNARMTNVPKNRSLHCFEHWSIRGFEFVSHFELRISATRRSRVPPLAVPEAERILGQSLFYQCIRARSSRAWARLSSTSELALSRITSLKRPPNHGTIART